MMRPSDVVRDSSTTLRSGRNDMLYSATGVPITFEVVLPQGRSFDADASVLAQDDISDGVEVSVVCVV